MRRLNNVGGSEKRDGSDHEAYKVAYRDDSGDRGDDGGCCPAMADDDCYWYWGSHYGWYVACDDDDWYDDDSDDEWHDDDSDDD
jgi:hypothetical protein